MANKFPTFGPGFDNDGEDEGQSQPPKNRPKNRPRKKRKSSNNTYGSTGDIPTFGNGGPRKFTSAGGGAGGGSWGDLFNFLLCKYMPAFIAGGLTIVISFIFLMVGITSSPGSSIAQFLILLLIIGVIFGLAVLKVLFDILIIYLIRRLILKDSGSYWNSFGLFVSRISGLSKWWAYYYLLTICTGLTIFILGLLGAALIVLWPLLIVIMVVAYSVLAIIPVILEFLYMWYMFKSVVDGYESDTTKWIAIVLVIVYWFITLLPALIVIGQLIGIYNQIQAYGGLMSAAGNLNALHLGQSNFDSSANTWGEVFQNH